MRSASLREIRSAKAGIASIANSSKRFKLRFMLLNLVVTIWFYDNYCELIRALSQSVLQRV